jgi:ribose transport system ATP-binding protein
VFQVISLTKDFASRAVDAVNMQFAPGELHALLGANGAGKSTLCRMIAGFYQPTSGSMRLNGARYLPSSSREAQRLGVQMVQQELNLIPTLNVAENLFLDKLPHRCGILNQKKLHRAASELLSTFGLTNLNPKTLVRKLGIGQQQMLEIAANTQGTPKVLILDEPTATLSIPESQLLFEKIAAWKEQGTAILYISHRLTEVEMLADRISILRDGQLQGTWQRGELTQNDMIQHMSPRNLLQKSNYADSTSNDKNPMENSERKPPTGTTILQVEEFDAPPKVRNVSFALNAGEILGIAGLVGAGRTELLRLLFGADKARNGLLRGPDGIQRSPFHSPTEAVAAGFVMISEDRKSDGLLLDQSIALNIQLPKLHRPFWKQWNWYHQNEAQRIAEEYRTHLGIRCDSTEQTVATLSGGNQQKVVLAKWLERGGEIFLLDEPTRGIDYAAREVVYKVIRQLATMNKGILVVSSDLDELVRLCDRIGVLSNGLWTGEFLGPNYDQSAIVAAMFAGYDSPNSNNHRPTLNPMQ